ncbi:Vesicle-associated membrane protein 1 [Armadillidium vulgare]|nr:Vesicle-associated membrane protein 1 [Armadillidium vulgare]
MAGVKLEEEWNNCEGQNRDGNENIKAMQNQVNEVVGIMRSNVDKIMIRDERLSELDQRADQLNASASEFQTTSRKVKRKYWWKNIKMMLIIGGVVALIIVIVIISIVGIPSSGGDSSSSSGSDSNDTGST